MIDFEVRIRYTTWRAFLHRIISVIMEMAEHSMSPLISITKENCYG